jgi:isopenicillin N synthase-like dioxygenase
MFPGYSVYNSCNDYSFGFAHGTAGRRMRTVVLAYMAAMRRLGDVLMHALAASLGLRPEYFGEQFDHPTQLFRMFHYPPHDPKYGENSQAVGEHTDDGYLTILKQDYSGGLQVKSNE